MVKFLFLILSIYSFQAAASDVLELVDPLEAYGTDKKIISAELEEFDLVRLTVEVHDSGDHFFYLVCKSNTFYDFDKSVLVLTHDSPLRGLPFKMDDQDCDEMLQFMKNRFEYISSDFPLEIKLDMENKKVKKIRWKMFINEESNQLD